LGFFLFGLNSKLGIALETVHRNLLYNDSYCLFICKINVLREM